MKDVSLAREAREAFLRETGSNEGLWRDEQLVLDLYTLLVLVKGQECKPEDIRLVWLVAGLRYGANPPVGFDALDDSIPDGIHDLCAQDDWVSVLNAASSLEKDQLAALMDRAEKCCHIAADQQDPSCGDPDPSPQ